MAQPLRTQLTRSTSRRQFLGAMGATVAGLTAAAAVGTEAVHAAGLSRAALQPARTNDADRLAWVWNFREDGHPYYVREVLARHNMGIMLKTHDGTSWMRGLDIEDDDRHAVDRIARIASFFEDAGVPFHAWSVANGTDPKREAEMAHIVTSAGARSLVLDLESYEHFWEGTPADAVAFGRHLRRLRRDATVSLTVDPRPWELQHLPIEEFAPFTREILPQTYWGMFGSQGNVDRYAEAGFDPGEAGVTPQFVVDVTTELLAPVGHPIAPIGDGTVTDHGAWNEFLNACSASGARRISVWRLGVTSPDVLAMLDRSRSPRARRSLPTMHPLLNGADYPFAP